MASKLIIVESPAKAKTIGKFLGRGYKVEASQGHVRDLPKSQIAVDPENNFEPKYITIRGRGEILARIRKEAKNASKIYLATDPDREGEAISWHLATVLGIDEKSTCRIEFNEITEKAIKAAVKSPRAINMDLVNAQQARRVLDRLVGYKISPILWAKVKKGLSAGRVQSVATAMICDRENEINTFEPEEYWNITGSFENGKGVYQARFTSEAGVHSKAEADEIVARAKNASFTLRNLKTGERKRYPAPPFTTSNLQQEASRKLGFTTAKTMQIAQMLYEGIDLGENGTQGLVTYIRTDSTRTADEAIEAVRATILERYGEAYLPEEPNRFKSRKNAQDAHEAIRPTGMERTPAFVKPFLTRDQLRLYKLIYDRFLSSQMTNAVYDTVQADLVSDDLSFRVSGQKLRFDGFSVVYVEGQDDAAEEASGSLPEVAEGETPALLDITAEQKFTQPPQRYTEASLVRALEEKGIGRPSTYAPTISTIIARNYVARENKRLVPTELGSIINDLMTGNFPDIVNIEFTADMEEQLDGVEAGKIDWHDIIGKFYGPFEETIEKAEASIEKVQVADQVSDVVCDKCGAMMVYKIGRFGKFLACPNFPECRNTQTIVVKIDANCPLCGGGIVERTSKKGRRFYGCEHYPECSFVSWDQPVNDKCPECGGNMVRKFGKNGAEYHLCVNEQCRHKVSVSGGEQANENE